MAELGGRALKTLYLLRAGFGLAALLVAIVAGVSIRNHVVAAETHALQEAQSVTKVLELLLVRHAGDREGDPLATKQAELQRDVETLHGLYGQDIAVLDRDKRIVADAVAPEIGSTYQNDTHDEVARTIVDGTPRTFIETSPAYPQGIKELVVPLRIANATVGALILEYTSIYDAAWRTQRPQILAEAAATLAIIILGALGLFVTRHVTRRDVARHAGTARRGRGDPGQERVSPAPSPRPSPMPGNAIALDGRRRALQTSRPTS